MPKVTYIEFNGTEHPVEVPVGLSVMRGAVNNNVPGIDADRIVRLTSIERKEPGWNTRSRCGNRISPLVRRLGSEDPERRARDEMALEIEGVVDGGVHAEKPLGGASYIEPLYFALSSSHRLMRIFGSIILSQPLLMWAGQSQTPECAGVRAQLVGDQQFGYETLLLE